VHGSHHRYNNSVLDVQADDETESKRQVERGEEETETTTTTEKFNEREQEESLNPVAGLTKPINLTKLELQSGICQHLL